jgi:benzylsuccinate CoA-transferase BbsE subunit
VLSKYRVLDLTDERGIFCGRILGDLGADVIKIEPPWGDSSRRIGPFYRDIPGVENSLFWQCYSTNKRSLTLDLQIKEARDVFAELVKSVDFLIESNRPGWLLSLGISYEQLREINPGLVMVSITPFGQTGPYRNLEATDLTGMALSGVVYLTGDEDRPPVRVTAPQFWLLGSAAGAAGAMIAHYNRIRTGRGQHVDVSCQQASTRSLSHAPQYWDFERTILKRKGPSRPMGDRALRMNWDCQDGYVNFLQPGGPTGVRSMEALIIWLAESGIRDEVLSETKWGEIGFGEFTHEQLSAMERVLAPFFKSKTKRELGFGAIERRILLFPVNDAKDVYEYPQLTARKFFTEMKVPTGRGDFESINGLGPFIQTTLPAGKAWLRAPMLGEHTDDILSQELGLSQLRITRLRDIGAV